MTVFVFVIVVDKVNLHRIHSIGRQQFIHIIHLYIGCREPHLAAHLIAIHHPATQHVGVAQQAIGLGDSSLCHTTAYAGRAHRFGSVHASRAAHHLNAQLIAIAHVVVEILGAPATETVVITYDQHCYAQLLLEHLPHKLACRELRHLMGKGEQYHLIHACLAQQRHTLVATGERGLSPLLLPEYHTWCHIEGHRHGSQATLIGNAAHLVQQAPVAAMHPVKRAYRGNTGDQFTIHI